MTMSFKLLHNEIIVDDSFKQLNGDFVICKALTDGCFVKNGDEIVVKNYHLVRQIFPKKDKIKIKEGLIIGILSA